MTSEIAPADPLATWRTAWPEALAVWSRFTRLQDPRLCETRVQAMEEGLTGSFAMIRLADQRVVIDLPEVVRLGLEPYALEILAHEIGHHVLAPATATDHARLLARIRRALPTLETHAPMVANLYTDLLINDRLQRQCGLRMGDIYRRLAVQQGPSGQSAGASPVWQLYMGIYEQLWQEPAGALGGPVDDAAMCGDAWLGARVIRVYASEWLEGAGRFAMLLLPRLLEAEQDPRVNALMDTRHAGRDTQPVGLDRLEDDELTPVPHPASDPRITGDEADSDASVTRESQANEAPGAGQTREPFEYGDILRAAGLDLDDHQIAVRYYRERALPHLIRFPVRPQPLALEPLPEGLEPWEPGDPLDAVDWLQTLMQSPRVVPGVTTVQRIHGLAPGREPEVEPIDLDLYVDSSGSMPNPQKHTSFLTLAGAVIALSALRAGARVQATLWSGKQQHLHTPGFVRSEDAILKVLTGYFGGATAFPIHRLRDTYADRPAQARATHILHISDDGITTMFDRDERGNSGWDVAAQALRAARGGGTMALNLYSPLPRNLAGVAATGWTADLLRARAAGWHIHVVRDMAELLAFARDFSRQHYMRAPGGASP